MSKISIKLIVAGRSYPLTINESEEATVRKAAEDINSSIQRLQSNYAVKDMQDLLAMTALQLSTRVLNTSKDNEVDGNGGLNKNEVIDALKALSNSIEEE